MLSEHLMLSAELRIRMLVRSLLWLLLALLAAIAGLTFFGVGLWLWIDAQLGSVAASIILGIVLLLVALFGVLMAAQSRVRYGPPRPRVGVDDLAEAFMAAVALGRSARRKR
jgi:UPF0716 family protein affecting phage T7 exclusion